MGPFITPIFSMTVGEKVWEKNISVNAIYQPYWSMISIKRIDNIYVLFVSLPSHWWVIEIYVGSPWTPPWNMRNWWHPLSKKPNEWDIEYLKFVFDEKQMPCTEYFRRWINYCEFILVLIIMTADHKYAIFWFFCSRALFSKRQLCHWYYTNTIDCVIKSFAPCDILRKLTRWPQRVRSLTNQEYPTNIFRKIDYTMS